MTVDSEHLMNTDDNDKVLTDEMIDDEAGVDLSELEDMDLAGMDAKEFATMVAEFATSQFPPEIPEAYERYFVRRYVKMVTPILKFGGFEKLTAGMTLGGVVDRHPWIGAVVCAAGLTLGLYVCWPRIKIVEPQNGQSKSDPNHIEWGDEE